MTRKCGFFKEDITVENSKLQKNVDVLYTGDGGTQIIHYTDEETGNVRVAFGYSEIKKEIGHIDHDFGIVNMKLCIDFESGASLDSVINSLKIAKQQLIINKRYSTY